MNTDDTADDVAGIENPGGNKTYSYAYLTLLFVGIAAALAGAVHVGLITPHVEVVATVTVGWIVEYLVAALAGLFLLWTFAQVANILGMGFIGGLVGVVARIAHNYELPNTESGDSEE